MTVSREFTARFRSRLDLEITVRSDVDRSLVRDLDWEEVALAPVVFTGEFQHQLTDFIRHSGATGFP